MSESITPKTVTNFDHPPRRSKRNRARLDDKSDQNIVQASADDSDNPLLSEAALREFRPVDEVHAIRLALNLTQEAFARDFDIPLGTLRDWEQHRSEPDKAAQNYLKIISVAPDTARQALAAYRLRGGV